MSSNQEKYDKAWKNLSENAFQQCAYMQNRAMAFLSKKKIGSCIAGLGDDMDMPKLFSGFNIELSYSHVYHAEEIALINCLLDACRPIIVFVTSKSFEETVALCGDCRQKLLNANKDIRVVVFNPDGCIKIDSQVSELTKYSKSSGKIDWVDVWNTRKELDQKAKEELK